MNQDVLAGFLKADDSVMSVLKTVRDQGPAGAYVAAGFVRNRYWDSLYDNAPALTASDVDVVYFDVSNTSKVRDAAYEQVLSEVLPNEMWEVRNQARMHTFGGHAPFTDISHALRHWPETATAIGARLDHNDNIIVLAPFGVDDLFAHVLRITPIMSANDPEEFNKRYISKRWQERWPDLTVIDK